MNKNILNRLNALRIAQGRPVIVADAVDNGYMIDGSYYTEKELESYVTLLNVDTLIIDNL